MQVKAVLAVVIGCAIIIFCFSPLAQHYADRLYGPSERRAPVWVTRMIGAFVGGLFLLIAFTYFLYG
jgi:hypothetical protein